MDFENNRYKGALSMILYELNYNRNKDIKTWGNHQKEYFLNVYGEKKIKAIGDCVQHYLKYKDIDLNSILPSMDSSVKEKEDFLKFILNGFIDSGFIKENQE